MLATFQIPQRTIRFSIYKAIGLYYENGWRTNCHCRYRCFKGGRNTKKSYDIDGYEVIDKILSDSRRNILIVRQTFSTHKQSTFATLMRIINQPDINNPNLTFNHLFKINKTDLTITRIATGQVILFRGMDDANKITSIRVVHGFLTDVYFEEAFELESYEEFRKIDGTIRGPLPDGLFYQITFCFNAWNKDHWLYERFFKGRLEDDFAYLETHPYSDFKDEDLLITGAYGRGLYLNISTFRANEFRTEEYDEAMEELKNKAIDYYKVEALGMWGNAGETTYSHFNDKLIISLQDVMNMRFDCYAIGIDTGLSDKEGKVKYTGDERFNSACTMQLCGLSKDLNKLVCIDEYFTSNQNALVKKTEPEIMEEMINKIIEWLDKKFAYHYDLMKGVILVYVDCADIGFRQGLQLKAREHGLINIVFQASTKMKIQTRVGFINLIMAYGDFLICEDCKNLIREIRNSRKGEKGEPREDFDDHSINANEYAWASFINKLKRWKTFKQR